MLDVPFTISVLKKLIYNIHGSYAFIKLQNVLVFLRKQFSQLHRIDEDRSNKLDETD